MGLTTSRILLINDDDMISSHPEWASYREAPVQGNWLQQWIKRLFRVVDYPFVLAYRGFGTPSQLLIQGHVFRGMALQSPSKHRTVWQNMVSLLKMFMVRTVEGAKVKLSLFGDSYFTETDAKGFFEFRLTPTALPLGWQPYQLELVDQLVEGQEEVKVESEAWVLDQFEHGLISDVDDTFLVSHVTSKLKKIYTLLAHDYQSRRPVEGVVRFYQALGKQASQERNPFFYVSSSEWNLYDFLVDFIQANGLPKGVLQLKELKDDLRDFFRSGYGSHDHKRLKIERILALYPERSFILLGDNGQHDPDIYATIVQAHPQQVKAVYIRGVSSSRWAATEEALSSIRSQDIPAFQFRHSREAFEHAQQAGFIAAPAGSKA
jgi:phosphatidate phosphatase APP1